MKAKQLYFALVTLTILLLAGFLGVGYGADKIMSSRAAELSKLRADSATLDELQLSITKDKQDIVKYTELNEIAKAIVPQDKDQSATVREIVSLAAQSGITKLTSITFPTSTLGVTGAASANPDLTQLTPVKDISGVYELQIIVTQSATDSVPYSQFVNFLSKLEQNRRTALVNGITITPDTSNPGRVSFTLNLTQFIKP